MHTDEPVDNDMDCGEVTFAPPSVGDSGPLTSHVYLKK
jgi:hypothetical protein